MKPTQKQGKVISQNTIDLVLSMYEDDEFSCQMLALQNEIKTSEVEFHAGTHDFNPPTTFQLHDISDQWHMSHIYVTNVYDIYDIYDIYIYIYIYIHIW